MDKNALILSEEQIKEIVNEQEALTHDAKKIFDQRIAYGSRRVYESDWRLFSN